MRAIALSAAVLGACFSPSPQAGAPCSASGACPDGLVCNAENRCEKSGDERDGALPIDSCAAVVCEADELVGCGARTTCVNGCAPDPQAHCRQLSPSNGVTPALLEGVTAEVNTIDLDFDTNTGEITVDDTTVVRPAGEGVISGIGFTIIDGVAVWSARSWTSSGAGVDDWKAAGANAITLYAATTISIGGAIDVGGSGITGGPSATNGNASTTAGTCRGRAGRSNAGVGAAFGEGGGGGGGRTAGGDGGASNQANPTGIGGTMCGNAPTTRPLVGGNAGGHGGQNAGSGGGGGGGALALVAMEQITITGVVTAPGAGGLSAATGSGGGGGGGGGGAILLEAPIVNVTGSVTANGGGGGAPAGGTDGNRGSLTSASGAAGGGYSCVPSPGATPVIRRGGVGGAGTTAPGDALSCTQVDASSVTIASQGGGGGGAAGRIEIRRISGATAGTTSPPAAVDTAMIE
jgi:hypothetical protein